MKWFMAAVTTVLVGVLLMGAALGSGGSAASAGAVLAAFVVSVPDMACVPPGAGPVVPAGGPGVGGRPYLPPAGGSVAALTPEQQQNAATIVGVGQARGVPVKGDVVAVSTALQESGLVNLPGGDADSIGILQQRPSQGWGTPAQLSSVAYQAGKFYDALLAVPGWQALPVTVAAQAVQRSAYPDAYARWEPLAAAAVTAVLAKDPAQQGWTGAQAPVAVGDVVAAACSATGAPDPTAGGVGAPVVGGTAGAVIAQAARWRGLPYSWGGGDLNGPTTGIMQGAGVVGMDCSSYVRYAYYHGAGVLLPRTTGAQYQATAGRTVETTFDVSRLAPGDLLFYDSPIGHVTLYAGGGMVWEEPHTGSVAREVPVYGAGFVAATRPLA